MISTFILDKTQRQAVEMALTSPLSIITGGPGTGKTTTVNTIINIYEDRYPEHAIHLCSPTGRAAKRLKEVTNHEASTIHRLLGYNPVLGFAFNEDCPLEGPGLLIADEASMMDIELADSLFRAIPNNVRVVLVGDVDQLPSVGPGSVLRDLISSKVIPVSWLDLNFRQNKAGEIATWADHIKKGVQPAMVSGGEVEVITVNNPEDAVPLAVEKTKELIKSGLTKLDFLCLAPIYKSSSGVNILNEKIRDAINPLPEEVKDKIGYRLADKVMVIKNNYNLGVMNGDVGLVVDITDDDILVQFDDSAEGLVNFGEDDLGILTLAYSSTVHKSQGSEAQAVIMVMTKSHYIMLQRNLFYTGITRAKKKLILICMKEAVKKAVDNDKIVERHSGLVRRLKG